MTILLLPVPFFPWNVNFLVTVLYRITAADATPPSVSDKAVSEKERRDPTPKPRHKRKADSELKPRPEDLEEPAWAMARDTDEDEDEDEMVSQEAAIMTDSEMDGIADRDEDDDDTPEIYEIDHREESFSAEVDIESIIQTREHLLRRDNSVPVFTCFRPKFVANNG